MSKNYISISKDFFEKVLNDTYKTTLQINEVKPQLKSVASLINLKDEEIELLTKAIEMLENKMEIIEELTESPNNEFYNSNN